MLPISNLHTHSTYCDGSDELEDIVKEAISKGFDTIGFSGHSYTPFDTSWCMTDQSGYASSCLSLKEKYRDRINILLGVEEDYFAPAPSFDPDYIIGSVHYVKFGKEYIPIDESAEIIKSAAKKYFSGSTTPIAIEYFKLVGDVVNKTNCDIIGHFDLISKFSERVPTLFDINDPEYIEAEQSAIKRLLSYDRLFEVNTGAMARGYRTAPYPSLRCLEAIYNGGGRVIITSDCHKKEFLDYGFPRALELIKSVGFKEVYTYVGGKISSLSI